MPRATVCRLCTSVFHNCKPLYDEAGQYSDVYGIASKYFEPKLLNPDQKSNLPVICVECWQHISDFYSFQQSVYAAQAKQEDVKKIVSVIKIENEHLIEDVQTMGIETNNGISLNDELKDEQHISDVETIEEEVNNPISSNDDNSIPEKMKTVGKRKFKKRNKLIEDVEDKQLLGKKQCKRSKSKGNPNSTDAKVIAESSEEPYESVNNEQNASPHGKKSSNDKKNCNKHRTIENDAFIAAWRSELECELCHSAFANFKLLSKHFIECHPAEKCYVLCCERKFNRRFHIIEHIRLHMDPNAFKCKICGRCTTNSRNLIKHIRELHAEEGKQRPFECTVCRKTFINKSALRIHMETHETNLTHMCKECHKGFPSEQRRNLHERKVHNADRICDQCGKTLHGPYALKKHLLDHAGVEKQKWPCDQCGAELHSHSSLKRHKLLTHHDGSTVYVCSDCGKVATSEMALRSHKKNVHQNERKFKCKICEKSFKFPVVLREHIATHTGEDLYQCPHCTKTFKTNANMHHHRKKAHPKEWAEARLNKPQGTKIDFNLVQNEVVI